MDTNYWQEYWDSYYKFMAVYLKELQDAYPDSDIRNEYVEAANLFEPSIPLEDYEDYDEYDDVNGENYSEEDREPPFIFPGGGNPFTMPGGGNPFVMPGGGQFTNPFEPSDEGTSVQPFISPGGGQFTINNCRRMAVVRIVMRRNFNPSNFFMLVDRADRRSIQGYRISCEGNRIRFVPMAVEYRNINYIECVF